MKKKVYVLFQTDIWQSKNSRVFCGVFENKNDAIDEAKKNDLYQHDAEVVIIETTLNQFGEI